MSRLNWEMKTNNMKVNKNNLKTSLAQYSCFATMLSRWRDREALQSWASDHEAASHPMKEPVTMWKMYQRKLAEIFCFFLRPEPTSSPREPRRPRDLSSERDRRDRRNEDLDRAMEKTEAQARVGIGDPVDWSSYDVTSLCCSLGFLEFLELGGLLKGWHVHVSIWFHFPQTLKFFKKDTKLERQVASSSPELLRFPHKLSLLRFGHILMLCLAWIVDSAASSWNYNALRLARLAVHLLLQNHRDWRNAWTEAIRAPAVYGEEEERRIRKKAGTTLRLKYRLDFDSLHQYHLYQNCKRYMIAVPLFRHMRDWIFNVWLLHIYILWREVRLCKGTAPRNCKCSSANHHVSCLEVDIRQAPYLQSEDEDPTAKQKVQLCHVQMYYCMESNLTSTKLLEAFHRQSWCCCHSMQCDVDILPKW